MNARQLKDEYDHRCKRILELAKIIDEIWEPFNKQIAAIQQDASAKARVFRVEYEQLNKGQWEFHNKVFEAEKQEAQDEWKGRVPKTPDEFKSWVQYGDHLMSHRDHNMTPLERVPFIANGVTVFAVTDYEYKRYAAIQGDKLLGYLEVRMSEHAGDGGDAAGWIGGEPFKNKYGANCIIEKPVKTWVTEIRKFLGVNG